MTSPPPPAKPKAGTKWVSRTGIPVRSPSLLGSQQPTAPEQDTSLAELFTRDTTAPASPASDSVSLKSGPKWASKLGAAVKRTPSVVSLSRLAAASAPKERDSDTISVQTTASRESVASSSRPGTPSTERNGKGPKWASKLGAAVRRSPSMSSLARPTAASAAKESDAVPAPVRKSDSPTPEPIPSPEASRGPTAPSSGEAPKAPSPPRALAKADKASKPRPPPADTAGTKPKAKWASKVGGAVHRSSLLGTGRPVTAAKEDSAPPARAPAYRAGMEVPAVIRAPSSRAHEADVLAESATEEVEVPTAPLDARVDERILDQERATGPLQDVELRVPSETADDGAFDDTHERPESPFADSVPQELAEGPSSASMDIDDAEHVRPVSPFADVASLELPEPVAESAEVDASAHERRFSPLVDVDSSEYAEEAPGDLLAIDAVVHERSASPFADVSPSDYVEEPKAIVDSPFTPVVEEPAERSTSPFEDIILPAEDLPPVVDAHAVEPAAQIAQERAINPFDDAASVTVDVHRAADIIIDVSVRAAEAHAGDRHPAASTHPMTALDILPDPAFSAVLVEAPLTGAVGISTESEEAVAEQPIVSADEDHFADPSLTQLDADESWTIVDSQAGAGDELVAVPHEYGLYGTNPWAASAPVGHEGVDAPRPAHMRADGVNPVEEANVVATAAESETVIPADIVHPAAVALASAAAVAAPVPAARPEPLAASAEPTSSPAVKSTVSPATPTSGVPPSARGRATRTPPTFGTNTTTHHSRRGVPANPKGSSKNYSGWIIVGLAGIVTISLMILRKAR